jgi:hypothetical protein
MAASAFMNKFGSESFDLLAGSAGGFIKKYGEFAKLDPASADTVLEGLRGLRDDAGKPLIAEDVIAKLETGLSRGEVAYAKMVARQQESSEMNKRLAATNGDLTAITELTTTAFSRGESGLQKFKDSGVIANLTTKDAVRLYGDAAMGAIALSDAIFKQTGSTDEANAVLTTHKQKLVDQMVAAGMSTEAAMVLVAKLFELSQQRPTPKVNLDGTPFDKKKWDIDHKIAETHAKRATPVADLDKAPFDAKKALTFGGILALSSWRGAPTVDANDAPWWAKKDALRRDLDNIGRSSAGPGIGGGGGFNFSFFAEGGLVPGRRGEPLPATVHGGEYVLSADVVDRIRRGAPSQGAEPFAPAGPPGAGLHIEHAYFGDRAVISDLDYFAQTRMAPA